MRDEPEDEYDYIYRPWVTRPDGTKIYAKHYGKKAFRIPVRKGSHERR